MLESFRVPMSLFLLGTGHSMTTCFLDRFTVNVYFIPTMVGAVKVNESVLYIDGVTYFGHNSALEHGGETTR